MCVAITAWGARKGLLTIAVSKGVFVARDRLRKGVW